MPALIPINGDHHLCPARLWSAGLADDAAEACAVDRLDGAQRSVSFGHGRLSRRDARRR
jgi:hypothetical protein